MKTSVPSIFGFSLDEVPLLEGIALGGGWEGGLQEMVTRNRGV